MWLAIVIEFFLYFINNSTLLMTENWYVLLCEDIYFSGKLDKTIFYLHYSEHRVSAWKETEKHEIFTFS